MAQAVEEWYKQMPIITSSYLTAAIITNIGCSLEVLRDPTLFMYTTHKFESLDYLDWNMNYGMT